MQNNKKRSNAMNYLGAVLAGFNLEAVNEDDEKLISLYSVNQREQFLALLDEFIKIEPFSQPSSYLIPILILEHYLKDESERFDEIFEGLIFREELVDGRVFMRTLLEHLKGLVGDLSLEDLTKSERAMFNYQKARVL
ncbi:hypothetical protein [Leminorella grimontii]|uniref:hypothetical protein n=1 Tax=Leminorella grimontii TaxID=82981 RepID=UPI0032200C8C